MLLYLFGWTDLLYVFGHGGVRLALALSGIRYRIAGSGNLPHDRAAVYCCNHQSNVDPPLLYTALHPRMHILYKHEIDRIPVLARAFRMGGFIPIDRRRKERRCGRLRLPRHRSGRATLS
jgi:1-acyl-sn-glycerol-3-phosphate acyltransferase